MIEVQVSRGDHNLDAAEADTPEAAIFAALTLCRDDMEHYGNGFPGRLYGARFFVDGKLSFLATYSDLLGAQS